MGFSEIFEKYKNGTASEEEILIVEEELEKNELINEYLSEGFEEEFKVSTNDSMKDIKNGEKICK